jgi:hypothetical protein
MVTQALPPSFWACFWLPLTPVGILGLDRPSGLMFGVQGQAGQKNKA